LFIVEPVWVLKPRHHRVVPRTMLTLRTAVELAVAHLVRPVARRLRQRQRRSFGAAFSSAPP